MLHVVFLPGLLGVLFAYHMWRVRKDGGLARADAESVARHAGAAPTIVPTKTYTLLGVARGTAPTVTRQDASRPPDTTVNAVPDLTRRAAIATLGTIAVVSILSVFIASPLEEPANALVTPNPAKAPWYFLWLQEIVTDTTIRIGSFTLNGAFVGGVILPGLLVALLTIWPWLDRSSSRRGRRVAAAGAAPPERRVPVDHRRGAGPDVHRHGAARALLEHLLAVAGLAGDPREDLRWRNAPPRRIPAWTVGCMAVIGVAARRRHGAVHRGATARTTGAITRWSSAEWSPRNSARTRVAALPAGVQQIWVGDLSRADRCITCHQATEYKGFENAEQPYRTHPPEPLKTAPDSRTTAARRAMAARAGRSTPTPRTARWRIGKSRSSADRSATPTRSPATRTR